LNGESSSALLVRGATATVTACIDAGSERVAAALHGLRS
jgi:hypothetical protein